MEGLQYGKTGGRNLLGDCSCDLGCLDYLCSHRGAGIAGTETDPRQLWKAAPINEGLTGHGAEGGVGGSEG